MIAAFLIDRLVTGLLHALAFDQRWSRIFPDPAMIVDDDQESEGDETKGEIVLPSREPAKEQEPAPRPAKLRRIEAERRIKLAYYGFASLLAIVVIAGLGQVRMFDAVGFHEIHPMIERILTASIIVAGADRLAGVLKLPGSPVAKESEPRPFQITGELTIKDPRHP